MKHLFAIFVPLCIVCYIGFGVSLAVLGTKDTDTDTAVSDVVITDTGSENEEYQITEQFDKIELNTSFYNVTVSEGSSDITTICVIRPENDLSGANFTAKVSGDTLVLHSKTSHSGMTQFWKNLAHSISSGDFSNSFGSVTVNITVPAKIYDSLNINVGSGKLSVDKIAARDIDIDMGSGTFNYIGKKDFTADKLDFDMGSGKSYSTDLSVRKYDIEIGSGSFDLNGLRGSGSFEMGSGSGTLGFAEYTGNSSFGIGSGSLDIELPENTNATVSASVGSGKVYINACGANTTMKHSGEYKLGSGGAELEIDLGSGKVNILNAVSSAEQAA